MCCLQATVKVKTGSSRQTIRCFAVLTAIEANDHTAARSFYRCVVFGCLLRRVEKFFGFVSLSAGTNSYRFSSRQPQQATLHSTNKPVPTVFRSNEWISPTCLEPIIAVASAIINGKWMAALLLVALSPRLVCYHTSRF